MLYSVVAAGSFAPPLKVVENNIVDANNRIVRVEGFAVFDANKWNDKSLVAYWKNHWKANGLRLVLRPDQWFINYSATAQEAYLKRVDTFLEWCKEYQIYVIFDGYHESGSSGNVDFHWQYCEKAWRILAPRYKHHDHIVWEIYNEPYQISWTNWVPKARTLIDLIRSYNPVVNACIVPAVDWATELDFAKAEVDRKDLIYSFHIYPHVYNHVWEKSTYKTTYDAKFGFICRKKIAPVLIGEWHAKTTDEINRFGPLLLSYAKEIGASQTQWGYFPGWGGNLVDNGLGQTERKSAQGVWYHQYLNSLSPIQPAEPHCASGPARRFIVNSDGVTCYNAGPDIRFRIFDMRGCLIRSGREKTGNSGYYGIPLPFEKMSAGAYFMELEAGQTKTTISVPVAGNR